MPTLVEPPAAPSAPTIVLVHGAGHTSRVWEQVQALVTHRSLAVDVPGRRDRPGDLTGVRVEDAAESIAADVTACTRGRLVLAGHSTGGIVLPALTARLDGRVDHLVFVAGLSAKEGEAVIDTVRPGSRGATEERLGELRARYAGRMLDPVDGAGGADGAPEIDDARAAMGVESLNFMTQTMSWSGVAPDLPRTFVRCLRDAIQPPELQARLVENCGATTVVDLDSGHTPARDAPVGLAAVLDGIATGSRPPR